MGVLRDGTRASGGGLRWLKTVREQASPIGRGGRWRCRWHGRRTCLRRSFRHTDAGRLVSHFDVDVADGGAHAPAGPIGRFLLAAVVVVGVDTHVGAVILVVGHRIDL